ncbi:MAG TPA: AsmA family protein [Pseudolabrys sp.]|nr:AsmA family protein [Pseudolabrys sp.]
MQTTLLGIAIAIILALVAALVGPLLLDWSSYRTTFETEASRLIGVNVRVTGRIDARLLPSPRLTLNDIQIGDGGDTIRARSLGVEFSLGSLLRGEWRATELSLVGPQLSLGMDASGRLQTPNLAVAFRPDELSIERLSIEDGTIALADAASGAKLTLAGVGFKGDARSLAGPVKGEGAVTVSGALYSYRLMLGRVSETGAAKIRFNVASNDHPVNFEADGTLAVTAGAPRFDGSLSLARPVGIGPSRSGSEGRDVTQPWRVSAKVKATAQSALMQDVEFQYGSEEKGFRLTGVADFKFGMRPRLDAVLSGRQIDVDRAVSGGSLERQTPAAVIRQLAALGANAFRTGLPIQIGIGIDQATLGGNVVQNLRGDISSTADGWNLDRLEFRAPGPTQARLSGRLAIGAGVAFTGPVQIDSSDPKALALWLEGRSESTPGDVRPLSLRGEVTLASDRIAVEGLKAEFDRRPVAGRLAYFPAAGNRATRLEAELKTPQLDIEAMLAFGRALLDGSKFERPHEMVLAIDVAHASYGGIDARDMRLRLQVDPDGLQIDHLAIGDIGGGSFTAAGRVETKGDVPRGSLAADLETAKTSAIAAIAEKVVPERLVPLAKNLERIGHAKLHATLDVAGGDKAAATGAQVAVAGTLDDLRIDAKARLSGDWQQRTVSDVDLNATVNAAAASLIRFVNLDTFLVAGTGPAQLKARLSGRLDGDLAFDLQLAGDGLSAQFAGKGRRLPATDQIQGDAQLRVREAYLQPLRPGPASGNDGRLALTLSSRVALAAGAATFDDIDAKLGASDLHGRLRIEGSEPRRIDGALNAGMVDGGSLVAAAIGLPRTAKSGSGWAWSTEPFGPGLFGKVVGEVALNFGRAELLPGVNVQDFRGTARFTGDGIALEGAGDLAGGTLNGSVTFRSTPDGLAAATRVSLDGADAAALFPAAPRPPMTGPLNLRVEGEGTGLSAVALIGSAKGSGTIELADAQLAGLDPRAFDTVTRAVDQGLAIEQGRVAGVVRKSLGTGRLAVRRAESALLVGAGQIRLDKTTVESRDAALDVVGSLDLTDGRLDARLALSGRGEAAGARPQIVIALKGPMSDVSYDVDVSALTAWLTLRGVENQTKRLHAIERAPSQPTGRPAPRINQAPPLPAPTDIKPAPKPRSVGQPAASVRTQN